MSAVRTMALWCPDWPVIAAGLAEGVPVHEPVVVLAANRVLACSPAARAEGVRRGLRKREAQARCPRVVVVEHDPDRDARMFEPVVAAVEELAPGVEVLRPGACGLAARGPASYYGSLSGVAGPRTRSPEAGEATAGERLVEQVALRCGVEAQVGVADGVFAALLAARAGQIVPSGDTPRFLAGMDIDTLDRPELTDLLRRLGVHTLGDFARLPVADVVARFGSDAGYAHRLASGRDDRPLAVRRPPPELTVSAEYDPTLDRVDTAAFAARTLAEQLHDRLAGYGLAATRLGIEARTAAGEELHRMWRYDGLLDAVAIADRVRWQLDGWLTGRGVHKGHRDRPTAGIDRLRLVPDGVVRHAGMQAGLWGETGPERDRAQRALVRVQSLLGPDAVVTAVLGGGRSYADRARLVPFGDERTPERGPEPPWPGRLPAPAPAVVPEEPIPADVRTGTGERIGVTSRLAMTGEPAYVAVALEPLARIAAWAGPWPVEERWWAPAETSRVVRLQVVLEDARALLLALAEGEWVVEAVYD